jgi:hypothetical protein
MSKNSNLLMRLWPLLGHNIRCYFLGSNCNTNHKSSGYPIFTHSNKKRVKSKTWAEKQFFKALSFLMGLHSGISLCCAISYASGVNDCLKDAGYYQKSEFLRLAINEVYFLNKFIEFPKVKTEVINE